MPLIGISLDAVTTTGVGNAIEFDVPKTKIGMQITTTGSPASIAGHLEGTIDGQTFVALGTSFSGTGIQAAALATGDDLPVIAIRANLTTLTGGTSPTVTVTISAA